MLVLLLALMWHGASTQTPSASLFASAQYVSYEDLDWATGCDDSCGTGDNCYTEEWDDAAGDFVCTQCKTCYACYVDAGNASVNCYNWFSQDDSVCGDNFYDPGCEYVWFWRGGYGNDGD